MGHLKAVTVEMNGVMWYREGGMGGNAQGCGYNCCTAVSLSLGHPGEILNTKLQLLPVCHVNLRF